MGQYLLDKLISGLELEDEVDEESEDTQGQDEEEEYEDDDGDTIVLSLEDDDLGAFLPVQTPKQLPPQSYKQSDPEWQEFIRLNRDPERQTAIRRELAESVMKAAEGAKPLKAKLGKDIKWNKFWLDFVFPNKAAPEYIRRG